LNPRERGDNRGIAVARDGAVTSGASTAALEAAGVRVSWRGFAYVPGHAAGAPSIERFAARAARDRATEAAAELRGVYLAVVEDRTRRVTHAFVDPSGLFDAFWSAGGVGDDFLALARAAGCSAGDLDPEAVAELLLHGHVHFGRTPFASIRRIGAGEVLAVPWDGSGPRLAVKSLPRLDEPPPLGLLAQLERLVPALEGRRVSLDLTGGVDSRLLAVALARLGVPFEAATAGAAGSVDVTIARRVATALGRPHHVTTHRPEALGDEIEELLIGSGCVVDPLLAHRDMQLQRERAARGIEVAVSAVGGELLKDFWWLQDFPRYRSPRADLDRLWRTRVARGQAGRAPLAGEYATAADHLAAGFVRRAERWRRAINTETYDAIYFHVRMPTTAGRSLTDRNRVLAACAPLLDLDVARLGFALPRRARFFNGFHRRTLTALAPEIARLPTTEGGVSASAAAAMLPLDGLRWARDKAGRMARKAGLRRARPPVDSPLPALYRQARALPMLGDAVDRLREAGVLAGGCSAAQLTDAQLGGTLALARLLEELGDGRAGSLPEPR
jgi:hypothetical protein